MKARFLASVGVALTLVVSACSSGAPVAPTSAPTTSAPAAPTAEPTLAPTATAVPTVAPTAVPTIAPSATTAPTPSVAPTSTPAAQAAASASGAVPPEIIQSVQALAAVKSYRMTVESGSANQSQPGQSVIEVVKPDRFHVSSSTGGQSIEVISIGQDTYLKIGGKWTKSPAPMPNLAAILSSDPQKLIDAINSNASKGTLTKGGTSQVNGTPCQEWTWVPASATEGSAGTLCISLADHLPLQFKSNDGKTSVTYSDFNTPISIEAPTM